MILFSSLFLVSQGNIDNAGGETDIEVTFDINVQ